MLDAHHIEITDEITFFKLHDIDKDGFWSVQEVSAIYGIERNVDPNAPYIKGLVERVYQIMDKDKDRFISLEEYLSNKLPDLTKSELEQEKAYKQGKGTAASAKKGAATDPKAKNNKKPVVVNEKMFKQEGANYIPNKFRA